MKDHTFGRICGIGLVPWAWFKEEEVCHFSIKKTNIKDVLSYLSRKCLKFVILFEELIRGTCRISIIMQAYLHKIPSSAVIGQNDVVILPPRWTTTARVTGLFLKVSAVCLYSATLHFARFRP